MARRSPARSAGAIGAATPVTPGWENGSLRVVGGLGREQQMRVGEGAAHGAVDAERAEDRCHVRGGGDAERGAEARHPAERRRGAQAAAIIRAGGERRHAGRQRRRRAAGGAAGGFLKIERVAGGAEHPVDGVAARAELRKVAFSERDRPGGAQERRAGVVGGGGFVILVQERAMGGAQPGDVAVVLDGDRQSVQRAERGPGGQRRLRFPRRR